MSEISQFIEWFTLNPWISFISLLLAMLGIILAIIFYFKSRKIKLPSYILKNNNLIRNLKSTIESIEISYKGEKVKNLTVTKMLFWNAGNETIEFKDIAIASPLRITMKNGFKILDVKIIQIKNPANQFKINLDKNQRYLDIIFDYIDKDEGIAIQIIHTGKIDSDIELFGTIKGVGKPDKKSLADFPLPISESYNLNKKFNAILFFVQPFILIGLLLSLGSFLFYIIIPIFFIVSWGLTYDILKRRIPKDFEIFEKEY